MDYDKLLLTFFGTVFAFLSLTGFVVILNYEDDIKAYQEVIEQQDQYITDLQRQVDYLQRNNP